MGISKYKKSATDTIYHLYNRGNQKADIFFNASDYGFYLFLLRKYTEKHSFDVICCCLMPNHIHLLVKQCSSTPPSKLISSMHTTYAMYINKHHKQVGHLFQGRFKQKIVQTDEYLAKLMAYIHLNPVEGGIVYSPRDYPWSSCAEYESSLVGTICNKNIIDELGLKKAIQKLTNHKSSRPAVVLRDAFD